MMNKLAAWVHKNGLINIKDGHGVVQTYYLTTGGYTWRTFNDQYGVPKTPGTWGDFWKRLMETYEVNKC